MSVRPLLLLGAVAAALLTVAPPAAAATPCDRLGRAGFARLGEQVMDRMTGSGGWSTAALALAAGLVGAALALLVVRGRRRPAHP